ncbi:hypothetical protein ACFXKC_09630 [Streptomyces sp. NPDC059340]|uniref:hypothetical protein n=1 Tax=Streptomyces sp. NPDC059340 TaxID=3346806 RepID=UPI0036A436B7
MAYFICCGIGPLRHYRRIAGIPGSLGFRASGAGVIFLLIWLWHHSVILSVIVGIAIVLSLIGESVSRSKDSDPESEDPDSKEPDHKN